MNSLMPNSIPWWISFDDVYSGVYPVSSQVLMDSRAESGVLIGSCRDGLRLSPARLSRGYGGVVSVVEACFPVALLVTSLGVGVISIKTVDIQGDDDSIRVGFAGAYLMLSSELKGVVSTLTLGVSGGSYSLKVMFT